MDKDQTTIDVREGAMTSASRLRRLLKRDKGIIVCPGVYDGLTARIALRDGFECLYMTGAGTAASCLGMPDLGIATMNDMLSNAAMIASLDRKTPVIADADTGYGGPLNVARTVKSYITSGVAGLHLEDQVVTKRCGHLLGKEIVDQDTFISRIKAAVMARNEMREAIGTDAGDIVIIARTDSLQVAGFDEAIERLEKAVNAGADVAFLEAPTSIEQCKIACARLAPTPVLLNMVPGGLTPHFSTAEAEATGFKLIIHPGLMLAAVYEGCTAASAQLKATGSVQVSGSHGPKDLFTVCGLKEYIAFDQATKELSSGKGV